MCTTLRNVYESAVVALSGGILERTVGRTKSNMLAEAGESYFCCVLMDIQMPVMDGYEAAREIRLLDGNASRVPIVAMTANAFAEDRQKALESGMDGHIAKPIDQHELTETLAKFCERAR